MRSARRPCPARRSPRRTADSAPYSADVVTSSWAMSDWSWLSLAPYSALPNPPKRTAPSLDGDLFVAQVAVRDLVVLQLSQRFPHSGHRRRRAAFLQRSAANALVRVQRPAPVEGADGDRRGVGHAQVADGDGHQGAMLDGAAHRRLKRRGLAAAQPQYPPQLAQARRRCVDAGRTSRRRRRRLGVLSASPTAPAARIRRAGPPSAR